MIIICPYCKKEVDKYVGYVNRAKNIGAPLYCSRVCSGLARRHNRTKEENKKIKSEYDRGYRKRKYVKIRRAEFCKSPKGRAMQKRNRDRRKEQHLQYCRTTEYRSYKKEYDKNHKAKKNYGEFWESSIILNQIEKILTPEKHEIRLQKGTFNKSQKRKRLWNLQQKI